jgi:hypothetical protein
MLFRICTPASYTGGTRPKLLHDWIPIMSGFIFLGSRGSEDKTIPPNPNTSLFLFTHSLQLSLRRQGNNQTNRQTNIKSRREVFFSKLFKTRIVFFLENCFKLKKPS